MLHVASNNKTKGSKAKVSITKTKFYMYSQDDALCDDGCTVLEE